MNDILLKLGEQRDKAHKDVRRLEQTLKGVEKALEIAKAKRDMADEMFEGANKLANPDAGS